MMRVRVFAAIILEREADRAKRNARALSSALGKWPGDETDEEINKALEDIS